MGDQSTTTSRAADLRQEAITQWLPVEETLTPGNAGEVADIVRQAASRKKAVYPVGGGTSLDYGVIPSRPGWALSLEQCAGVVDYPARDLTVTVQAGITMAQLDDLLQQEGQWLPVDVPHREQATAGGLVATSFNGPRRYGWGSIRDHVIGIEAVDGQGRIFHGGGRVVKNVAGYDFCKLLTGSLGILGVITQLTFKVKPRPAAARLCGLAVTGPEQAEALLTRLNLAPAPPSAIELLAGPAWEEDATVGPLVRGHWGLLLVLLEGTAAQVDWMAQWIEKEAGEQEAGISWQRWEGEERDRVWRRVVGFPAEPAALVVQGSVVSSAVPLVVDQMRRLQQDCSICAHAGNGIVQARFPEEPASGAGHFVVAQLRPLATNHQGHLVVLSARTDSPLTPAVVWGIPKVPAALLNRLKETFDPSGVLNPQRFP